MNARVWIPAAADTDGNVILAAKAERSGRFTCLKCGEEMWLRRGSRRQPHFAHKKASADCLAEDVLWVAVMQVILRHLDRIVFELSDGGGLVCFAKATCVDQQFLVCETESVVVHLHISTSLRRRSPAECYRIDAADVLQAFAVWQSNSYMKLAAVR